VAHVVFVDTSVLLNLLDVPHANSNRQEAQRDYKAKASRGGLILPLAAIVETGENVFRIADGAARRRCAQAYEEMLRLVVHDAAPFRLHEFGWDRSFLGRLLSGASTQTTLFQHLCGTAIGCGDLTILTEREVYLARTAKGTTASIWTYDDKLAAYS